MSGASCVYTGWVMHRRLRPRHHRFRYRAWWLLIDLDELPELSARLRWFSHRSRNAISFYDQDHGHDQRPLRQQVEQQLRKIGIDEAGGPIRLLCMPRVLGYAFNPLSVYFCHRRDGTLAALVYEVHNTFGERHSYAIKVNGAPETVIRQRQSKQFYVSPFMDMDMGYEFEVALPGDTLTIGIVGRNAAGPLIHAVLQADRRDLSDGQLLRLLVTHPLVTLKVIGAIHWEAFRLWSKRLRLHPHQPMPQGSDGREPTQPSSDTSNA
jgi:DUF1365 family protein